MDMNGNGDIVNIARGLCFVAGSWKQAAVFRFRGGALAVSLRFPLAESKYGGLNAV